MKRLFTCLSLLFFWAALALPQAQAQNSLTLAGNYQRYFPLYGEEELFPHGKTSEYYAFSGGTLRWNVGLDFKTTLNFEGSYMSTWKQKAMYQTEITTTSYSFGVNMHRYLIGAYNRYGGLYVSAGLEAGRTSLRWFETPDTYIPIPDSVYFKSKDFNYINANLGIGTEAYIGFAYIFGEAHALFNLNHYVDGTTIHNFHARDFWRARFGLRFPLGGNRPD